MDRINKLSIIGWAIILLSIGISSTAAAYSDYYDDYYYDEGLLFGLSALICGVIAVIWIVWIVLAIWVFRR